MNQLSTERRTAILSALSEGVSVPGAARLAGASETTIVKLLKDVVAACVAQHDRAVRKVRSQRPAPRNMGHRCDEGHEGPPELRGTGAAESAWTWVGICADSKLNLSWHIGGRYAKCAQILAWDLAGRIVGRPQVTSQARAPHAAAIEVAFGEHNCDYARLQEIYHEPRQDAARYSPCECVPAVAAGLATERWTIEHVVRLLDGA